MENTKNLLFTVIFIIILGLVTKFIFFPENSVKHEYSKNKAVTYQQADTTESNNIASNRNVPLNNNTLNNLSDQLIEKKEIKKINEQNETINNSLGQAKTSSDDYDAMNPFTTQYIDPTKGISAGVQDKTSHSNIQTKENSSSPVSYTLSVATPNPSNKTASFYLYMPASIVNSSTPVPVIVWMHGLGGNGRDTLPHPFLSFADTHGFAVLAPTFNFNDDDFNKRKSYQYPAAWAGNALIDMLQRAKQKGLNYSKLYLAGFSAGAQFVGRFSILHPELVDACAIIGNGGKYAPPSNQGVKYFYALGINENDAELRFKIADEFYSAATKYGIPIIYNKYVMGHEYTQEVVDDIINFFDSVKNGRM